MSYEWDLIKADANLAKHGVDFADAVSVFEDDQALFREDPYLWEDRYIAIGLDMLGRVLTVIFAYRGEIIRLISARQANRTERENYDRQYR